MTWLYTQLKFLPPHIESHVICERTDHLDQFPFNNLVSTDNDLTLWRLLGSRSWSVRQWRRKYRLNIMIKRCHAQLLHSHFGDYGCSNIAFANHFGLNHIVTFYGYDVSRIPQVDPVWREKYKELFSTAQLFLCEGPHLGHCLVELGCPKEKIKVHHLGVNVDDIPFRSRRWHPGEPLRVLIAGSFVEKKGIPYAIEALARVKKRVKLEISIIGDALDQERSRFEKQRILDTIARHGLQAQTQLMGFQPYAVLKTEAYHNHLFLSPSVTASDGDTEGGAPMTLIEMAASGMPIISSHHCDIPEVIENGVTGLLAEERDVDDLESKLAWVIDNYEQCHLMIGAARNYIEREFNASIQGRRLAAHYESVVPNYKRC